MKKLISFISSREIFYRQGFNDQEIVALSGAHAMGRCHADRSGYDGPWSRCVALPIVQRFYSILLIHTSVLLVIGVLELFQMYSSEFFECDGI